MKNRRVWITDTEASEASGSQGLRVHDQGLSLFKAAETKASSNSQAAASAPGVCKNVCGEERSGVRKTMMTAGLIQNGWWFVFFLPELRFVSGTIESSRKWQREKDGGGGEEELSQEAGRLNNAATVWGHGGGAVNKWGQVDGAQFVSVWRKSRV